jgi:two-component system, OmpR family, sensor kinase
MNRVFSLRIRMMFLFCAVVGMFLAGTVLVLYGMFSREIESQIDCRLLKVGNTVIASLNSGVNPASLDDINAPKEYFEVLDTSGRVLERSGNLAGYQLELGGPPNPADVVYRTVDLTDLGRERLTLIPFKQRGEQRVMVVSMPTAHNDMALVTFRQVALWVLPLSLLVTGLISVWYVGKSLRPITELTKQAGRMIEAIEGPHPKEFALQRSLEIQLPVSTKQDEIGRLASAYNLFFRRLGVALDEHRRFVSDASHELRTPLHVLQGETEFLLSRARSVEEYESTLKIINNELRNMNHIVDGLLTLSMADAGQLKPSSELLYLNDVVEQAAARIRPLAQAKRIHVEYDASEDVLYLGDQVLLQELCVVFLDNAVKYSPPDTVVRIRMLQKDGRVQIQFHDQGYGIASEDLPHIFERFYRGTHKVPNSDSRSGGLGLAIAEAIAHAQGASIECDSVVGQYTKFTVTFESKAQEMAKNQVYPELAGTLGTAVAG